MKKKIVNNKKPVKSIKKPAKPKTPSLHARISELEDQLLVLVARLDMAEAAIQVVKDAHEKQPPQKNIQNPWTPAPSPFPAWPKQPPHMWNWCVKEEYDTHKNSKNKATA